MKKLIKFLTAALCITAGVTALAACAPQAKFDEEGKIVIVVRADGSGTKNAFFDLIDRKPTSDPADPANPAKDPAGVVIKNDTAAIMAKVKEDGQAISYDSLGYVDNSVKKVKVGGVEATVENIKNGTYKISRPLRVLFAASIGTNPEYTGQKETGVTVADTGVKGEFLKFLMSKDAQQAVENEGYVSDWLATASAYAKNASVTGGTVKIAGSTSLKPLMEELAKKFKAFYSGVNVDVSGGGSSVGYQAIREGSTAADFGMISDDARKTGASGADGAAQFTVARDGIAVIVNNKNPITNITIEDLQNMFSVKGAKDTAKVKSYGTWKELFDGRTDLK